MALQYLYLYLYLISEIETPPSSSFELDVVNSDENNSFVPTAVTTWII